MRRARSFRDMDTAPTDGRLVEVCEGLHGKVVLAYWHGRMQGWVDDNDHSGTANIKRGMLRLWAVLSLPWIAVVVLFLTDNRHLDDYGRQDIGYWLMGLAGMKVPPLVVLLAAYAAIWVVRGFKAA